MARQLADYLSLTSSDARSQWRSLLARPPAAGRRQVDFVPVETLMCLAASLRVNHRQYGGSTAHLAGEPVPALAAIFSRPRSSILAKMANLDGSRRNGAKYEIEVAERLLGSPGALASTYRLLVAAARQIGISSELLPDFLDLEVASNELLLLGQEELQGMDVEEAIQVEHEKWRIERTDLEEQLTERLLVAAARVGQHRFALEVLTNHGRRCVFCGLRVNQAGEPAPRMLVASHIKPWRLSTAAERLDSRNGLAACPTHDVAFDTGLITVNGSLRIHVRANLEDAARLDPATRAAFGRPPLADALMLPAGAQPPRRRYLTWHQEHVFCESLR